MIAWCSEEESMSQKITNQLPTIIVLGAIWGFAEAGLGAGLQKCASLASGSIMTAAAFFFIAATWVLTKQALGLVFTVFLVSFIKMFDAFLLSLPLRHGAIANPIFAFWTEALAFLVIFAVAKAALAQRKTGQAVLGGLGALLAVNLFPLVKYATGIPACVLPGTNYPLSLHYAPIAVGLSLLTVPLGFWAGEKLAAAEVKHKAFIRGKTFRYLASPATLLICLLIVALIRISGR